MRRLTDEQKSAIVKRELVMQTSRSSGKGGQNVNKVESRVELSFDIEASQVLSPSQKQMVLSRPSLLTEGRYLRVQESRDRSQHVNRELAVRKLLERLEKALTPRKKRLATRPSRSSKEKKLHEKKRRSEIKQLRRGM